MATPSGRHPAGSDIWLGKGGAACAAWETEATTEQAAASRSERRMREPPGGLPVWSVPLDQRSRATGRSRLGSEEACACLIERPAGVLAPRRGPPRVVDGSS